MTATFQILHMYIQEWSAEENSSSPCLLRIRKIFREASCTPTHSSASLSFDRFELDRTLLLKPTAGKGMSYSNWLKQLHETTNNFCFQQQITFISYVNQFLLLCTKSPDKYICTTFSHAYNQAKVREETFFYFYYTGRKIIVPKCAMPMRLCCHFTWAGEFNRY